MKDRFIAAGLFGILGSHDIGNQVQRLDIAVEKSRIFIRAQLQRTRIVQRLPFRNRYQQRRFAGGIRISSTGPITPL